jgi:hypothetical protein
VCAVEESSSRGPVEGACLNRFAPLRHLLCIPTGESCIQPPQPSRMRTYLVSQTSGAKGTDVEVGLEKVWDGGRHTDHCSFSSRATRRLTLSSPDVQIHAAFRNNLIGAADDTVRPMSQ